MYVDVIHTAPLTPCVCATPYDAITRSAAFRQAVATMNGLGTATDTANMAEPYTFGIPDPAFGHQHIHVCLHVRCPSNS
jgi:hypothetical protein